MSRYLGSNGADVYFEFGGKRIPAHQSELSTSEWFKNMFESLPPKNLINMADKGISAKDFKEFLKFFYEEEPNFNLKNIEGIINLAKQSKVVKLLDMCENFLIDAIHSNEHQTFFAYHLASRYDARRLKILCEFEIARNTEKLVQSPSFLELPYEMLQNFLKCDTFGCDEKLIFNALLEWAKAACGRKSRDPSKAYNLRDQLKGLVHQIRFRSMSESDFDACLEMSPDLFSPAERTNIRRIIRGLYEKSKFSDMMRYSKSRYRLLECSRLSFYSFEQYIFREVETTELRSGGLILLRGFACVCSRRARIVVNVSIKEVSDFDITELFNQEKTLDFIENGPCSTYEADIGLGRPLLLRPEYRYHIEIRFRNDPRLDNNRFLSCMSTADFNTYITFKKTDTSDEYRGIISKIWLTPVDNKINGMGSKLHIAFYSAFFVMIDNIQMLFYATLSPWFLQTIRYYFAIDTYNIENKEIALFLFLALVWLLYVISAPILVISFIFTWVVIAWFKMLPLI